MRTSILLSVLMMVLLLAACGNRQGVMAKSSDMQADGAFIGAGRMAAAPMAAGSWEAGSGFGGGFGSGFSGESANFSQVAEASPSAPVRSGSSPTSPLAADRLLTKDGGLVLRVPNVDRAQQEAVRVIEGEGGLIITSNIGLLEAKIPPARFESTMDRLAAIGIVAQRWTNVQDVTEQVADLDLRIGVARETHGRLSDLLAKATKVEEMLQVERELRRLTEEIERLEGQRRGIQRRVDSSSITLRIEQLAEVSNQPRDTQSFPWITNTGIESTRVQGGDYSLGDSSWVKRLLMGRPFELGGVERGRLPDGLVAIMSTADSIIGTTPEDHRLRVRHIEPRQEASIEFWSAALQRSLESVRGYEVLSTGGAHVDDSSIHGTRLDTRVRFEGELWLYRVWVLRKGDGADVTVIEAAWREAEPGDLPEIAERAVAGLQLR